jgi:hypothetical protein
MEIFLSVGNEMMTAMMSRPPERTLLIRRGPGKRDQKLENSAGPIRAMREEAMKPGGDCKHADDVQGYTCDYCHDAHARPDYQQTCQMHEKKLNAYEMIQFVMVEWAGVYQ